MHGLVTFLSKNWKKEKALFYFAWRRWLKHFPLIRPYSWLPLFPHVTVLTHPPLDHLRAIPVPLTSHVLINLQYKSLLYVFIFYYISSLVCSTGFSVPLNSSFFCVFLYYRSWAQNRSLFCFSLPFVCCSLLLLFRNGHVLESRSNLCFIHLMPNYLLTIRLIPFITVPVMM